MSKRPIVRGQLTTADLPRQNPEALDQKRARRLWPELFPLTIVFPHAAIGGVTLFQGYL